MPELPEVEGLVEFLSGRIVGLRIADVQIAAISAIKTADPPMAALAGARVTAVGRAGKFLEIFAQSDPTPQHQAIRVEGPLGPTGAQAELADPSLRSGIGSGDDLCLAIHLSRAGWLKWLDEPPARPVRMGRGPLAARFTFVDDGGALVGGFDLTEAGTQKRLAMYLVRDPSEVPGIARLGPDPLADGFDAAAFDRVLDAAGKRHVKTLLRDQSAIAGVGNAYSDEILHVARISPAAPADSLDAGQRRRLFDALRTTLAEAIAEARSRPPEDLKDGKRSGMRVHGRTGKPCPVCGDTVREVASADSSFQYCPTCQNDGKILADRRLSRLLK